MNSNLRQLVIAVGATCTLLFSAHSNSSGLTAVGQVAAVTPGSASIRVEGLTGNPDMCADSGGGLYVLLYSNPRQKELYAGLLTAKAAGLDVRLFLNGCVNDGPKNLAEIKSIIIQ